MSSENHNNNSLEIPPDAVVLINKVGFSSELIQDKIARVSPDFSRRFHQELINSTILESWDGSKEWFEDGFPSQMLKPGEQWQKGRLRLRISTEFIPDEPEIELADRPSENSSETAIEPSLDAFRESP